MAKIHSFITTFSRENLKLTITDEKTIHQVFTVLRIEKGEKIYIGDGQNVRYQTEILEIDKKQLVCQIIKEELAQHNTPEIVIALATIKKESFEYALEKMTEVGVDGILPLTTDKVIKKGVNVERCEIILREASEQSGRICVPKLLPETDVQHAFEYFLNKPDTQLVFCDMPTDTQPSKVETKKQIVENPKSIIFFIGPEGGWSDREKLSVSLLGIPTYNLGINTLRAETAAIIATYLAVNNKL
ncbi:MAG: 16S rRNA (uracil(1498)-N(3))-methyltransferase [Candidatus Pacebacteria bacterium]|nr:16S rRNA (uracil(1498)-N(3))-methyltransferase [Candidatus Paceibacterota bacterium]